MSLTGSVSFIEHGDMDERENNKGNVRVNYVIIDSKVLYLDQFRPLCEQ